MAQPLIKKHQIDPSVFNGLLSEYEEVVVAGPLANTMTAAHSLAGAPLLVQVSLRCTSADNGYAVGDELLLNNEEGSTNPSVWFDGSNAEVRHSSTYTYHNKSGGGPAALTAARWDMVFRLWR